MNDKIKQEISLAIGVAIAGLEAVVATVPSVPDWLRIVLAVVVAVGGAFGIRQNVTPV